MVRAIYKNYLVVEQFSTSSPKQQHWGKSRWSSMFFASACEFRFGEAYWSYRRTDIHPVCKLDDLIQQHSLAAPFDFTAFTITLSAALPVLLPNQWSQSPSLCRTTPYFPCLSTAGFPEQTAELLSSRRRTVPGWCTSRSHIRTG